MGKSRKPRKRAPRAPRQDPDITPLPAPLPGLSISDAIPAVPAPRARRLSPGLLSSGAVVCLGTFLVLFVFHARQAHRARRGADRASRLAAAPAWLPLSPPPLPAAEGHVVKPPPLLGNIAAAAPPAEPEPPRPPPTALETAPPEHSPSPGHPQAQLHAQGLRRPVPQRPAAERPRERIAARPSPPAPSLAPVARLSREELRERMLRVEPKLADCIAEGWGSDVSLGVVVGKSGAVQRAEVEGPLGQSPTGSCMADKLKQLRFPPFTEGESKQFFWPYHLPAPGELQRARRRGG